MGKRFFLFVLLLVILLAAIVLINTWRFSRPVPHFKARPMPALNDSALRHMSEAVQIRTISYADSLPVDTAEYLRFRQFLERAYPLVHRLPRRIFNEFSYLFEWKGKDTTLAPYVLMAHMDVVPVEKVSENKWTVPPFGGVIKDSMIWGRGVVDDKGCVIPILEAAEDLLRKNFAPERTIYLSFGHDEEISGTRGASAIAAWFAAQKIHPEMVLDEGGEITVEQFPSLGRPLAAVAIAEKGYLSFRLSVEKTGGHSSMPEKETAMDILVTALEKLHRKQMPFRYTEPMEELLARVGPGLPFSQRMALANRWLFDPLLKKEFEKSAVTNAVFHTTIVPTVFNSGLKDNIIPMVATAIVNSRSLPGDSQDDIIRFMKEQIRDDRVTITPFAINQEASPVTSTASAAFRKVEQVCRQTIPDVVVSPYLLMGGTDSRHFDSLSHGIVRFAPTIDSKGYHGIDERLPISDFQRSIFFYSTLMQETGR